MAKLKVRGFPDAIDVSDKKADDLRAFRDNKTIPGSAELTVEWPGGYWSGVKADIRAIYSERPIADHGDDIIEKANEDYRAFRSQRLKMPPRTRAESLMLFGLIYWGSTQQTAIPSDIRDAAIELETKFYELNPKRIHPDPIIFKELLEGRPIHAAALRVVEGLVSADKFYTPEKSKWGPFANGLDE